MKLTDAMKRIGKAHAAPFPPSGVLFIRFQMPRKKEKKMLLANGASDTTFDGKRIKNLDKSGIVW